MEHGRRLPRWLPPAAILSAILLIGVLAGSLWVRSFQKRVFTEDAVMVIAGEIRDAASEDPSLGQREIEARIAALARASVIHASFDEAGRPLDLYGKPFRIIWESRGDGPAVTCTSAGPDGKLGTRDDIAFATDGG